MLNRNTGFSSTRNVIRHFGKGIMAFGGMYKVVEGLVKLTFSESMEDKIGETTATRLLFGALILTVSSFLGYRSHKNHKEHQLLLEAMAGVQQEIRNIRVDSNEIKREQRQHQTFLITRGYKPTDVKADPTAAQSLLEPSSELSDVPIDAPQDNVELKSLPV